MNSSYSIDFSKYNGQGIKVAIIDSGLDETHILPNIVHKMDLTITSSKSKNREFCKDKIGHGTACAGIISKKAPKSELIIIKIFDFDLNACYKLLLRSILYAIEQSVNVINLSLGTTEDFGELKKLYDICQYACQNNIIIVSAENNSSGRDSYPANFNNVIGVTSGKIYYDYEYFYREDNSIELIGKGNYQKVNWLMGQSVFKSGNSFAAPHITGIISLVLQAFPNSDIQKVKKILLSNSQKQLPA